MIRSVIALTLVASLLPIGGCSWYRERKHQRRKHEALMEAAAAATAGKPIATDEPETKTEPPPAPPPAPAPPPVSVPIPTPAPMPKAPPKVAFHQLVLLNDSPAGMELEAVIEFELSQVPARRAGELAASIYLPTGPAGTDHRYTLIYPTRAECAAALSLIEQLDVAPIDAVPATLPNDPGQAFDIGIGLIYGAPSGGGRRTEQLRQAESALRTALGATDQPALRRWAAGMIAGRLQSRQLGDDQQALAHFVEAGRLIGVGWLEQMAALYALARTQAKLGQLDQARYTLAHMIEAYRPFEATEVYRRATDLLADIERGTKP
jgi:hypothetical protein